MITISEIEECFFNLAKFLLTEIFEEQKEQREKEKKQMEIQWEMIELYKKLEKK